MKRKTMLNLIITALFSAMITVLTAYVCHIPWGGSGGYIHFGDGFIYLAACLLPTPYAIAAGAIGAGLADLLTAPLWFIPTVIIKSLITIPFTAKQNRIITARNIIAVFIAVAITVTGYYLAEVFLMNFNWTAPLVAIPGNLIQAAGSAAIFIALGFALDKADFKKKIFRRN
ncbi:MAG: TIGR04002 family protein [Clostridiales bacterium]|jgi:uncharacterized repeat protein (TIGR04002 family)|nr:TIGR04002 family protein [Clostridiales bacterium]